MSYETRQKPARIASAYVGFLELARESGLLLERKSQQGIVQSVSLEWSQLIISRMCLLKC